MQNAACSFIWLAKRSGQTIYNENVKWATISRLINGNELFKIWWTAIECCIRFCDMRWAPWWISINFLNFALNQKSAQRINQKPGLGWWSHRAHPSIDWIFFYFFLNTFRLALITGWSTKNHLKTAYHFTLETDELPKPHN